LCRSVNDSLVPIFGDPKGDGAPNSDLLMVADLCGDFREELVLGLRKEDGKDAVGIVTATEPIEERDTAALAHWLRRRP
jgi:hypothetical protein